MDVKKDFPIFESNPELIYLDSAATSQRPKQVIDSVIDFYENDNASANKSLYTLGERATKRYNEARQKVADFIGAESQEIVFTKNTTESINILCHRILPLLKEGRDEVVLSEMEHHSNLVPWQQFAKAHNFKLKFIPVMDDYELDYERAEELINDKTAIVSVTYASNVLGTINDVKRLIGFSKDVGAICIIDGAQYVAHRSVNVKDLDCDFFVFSSHKMLGPTGVGILYGRESLLEELPPFLFGGGMISEVTYEDSTWADLPDKFEAGTQNYAEAIGLSASIDYIEGIGFDEIERYEKELLLYTFEKLQIDGVKIFSADVNNNIGIISFNIEGVHSHDVAYILNEEGIAIRAGHHCAMPLIKKLGVDATCRISFGVYNSKDDVDKLIDGIKKVMEVFKK